MGIAIVIDKSSDKSSDGVHDSAMCSACEMAVIWMQNKLRRNETADQILNYVNQVYIIILSHISWGSFLETSLCPNLPLHGSFVTVCPVQMENQLLIVTIYLPCPMFHLQLVAKYLTLHRMRYGFMLILRDLCSIWSKNDSSVAPLLFSFHLICFTCRNMKKFCV